MSIMRATPTADRTCPTPEKVTCPAYSTVEGYVLVPAARVYLMLFVADGHLKIIVNPTFAPEAITAVEATAKLGTLAT